MSERLDVATSVTPGKRGYRPCEALVHISGNDLSGADTMVFDGSPEPGLACFYRDSTFRQKNRASIDNQRQLSRVGQVAPCRCYGERVITSGSAGRTLGRA